jgi:hypothetical protein
MSVLYECINTIINGIPDHQPSLEVRCAYPAYPL